jgi:hypothetical protein
MADALFARLCATAGRVFGIRFRPSSCGSCSVDVHQVQYRLPLVDLRADDAEIGRYAALLDSLSIGLLVFAADGIAATSATRRPIVFPRRRARRFGKTKTASRWPPSERPERQVIHDTRQPGASARHRDPGMSASRAAQHLVQGQRLSRFRRRWQPAACSADACRPAPGHPRWRAKAPTADARPAYRGFQPALHLSSCSTTRESPRATLRHAVSPWPWLAIDQLFRNFLRETRMRRRSADRAYSPDVRRRARQGPA